MTLIVGKRLLLMVASVCMFVPVFILLAHGQVAAMEGEAVAAQTTCDTVQGIPQSECVALQQLYNDTNGDNWDVELPWFQSNAPCDNWEGIRCQNGVVTEIDLTNRSLAGNLTGVDWGNFSRLLGLRLVSNEITGTIPTELAEMTALVDLWLTDNRLSGPIPEFGANCSAQGETPCVMWRLLLGRQNPGLTGSLPVSIANLSALRELDVVENQLSGPLPIELLELTSLWKLSVTDNCFTSSIPDFSRIKGLTYLALDGNCLEGKIPTGLGNLNTNLSHLLLANNRLDGPLPRAVACIVARENALEDLIVTLDGNRFYVNDDAAKQCLSTTSVTLGTQTVPPEGLRIADVGETWVELAWTALDYPLENGSYEIGYALTPNGEPQFVNAGSKSNTSAIIDTLQSDTQYYFHIRSNTPANGNQKNTLISRLSFVPIEAKTLLSTASEGIPTISIEKSATPASVTIGDTVNVTITMKSEGGSAIVDLFDPLPDSAGPPKIVAGNAQNDNGNVIFSGLLSDGVPMIVRYEYTLDGPVEPGTILYKEAVLTFQDEMYLSGAEIVVESTTSIDTLIAIYVSGDNNLGLKHTRDLFEKVEKASIADNVAVLLLYDGRGTDDAYYYEIHKRSGSNQPEGCGSAGSPFCGYELGKSMHKWEDDGVGTKSSLSGFLKGAQNAYDPDRFIVSLVGHGSGWSPDLLLDQPSIHDEKPDNRAFGGLLYDQNPTSALSTRQLGEALLEVTAVADNKIDLLYLDACLMAMSEVAYEVRDSVDYLLASESTSWTSFRYDLHLAADVLNRETIDEIAIQWIKNEERELDTDHSSGYPYTYSLLDLRGDGPEQLLGNQSNLASWLIQSLNGSDSDTFRSRIGAAYGETACFDSDQDHKIDNKTDNYCDLRSFAAEIQKQFSAASTITETNILISATDLSDYLDPGDGQFVRYITSQSARYPGGDIWNLDRAFGVSVYLPLGESNDWKRDYYKPAYLQSVAQGQWDEFLNAFWDYADASPALFCEEDCLPPGPGVVRIDSSGGDKIYLPMLSTSTNP